ncbi:MAG TPA: RtcB family protein [Vicinamibacterales bacterium]|nr:RtcB family protein [Vicinamibacterales bacterium]
MIAGMSLVTFGPVEDAVRRQIETCQRVERAAPAVLCADNHIGYSMPIGGVVGYESHVSPSAVGFDIACGNCAVRTDVSASSIDRRAVMDEIWRVLSFGIGRRNAERVEHSVLDEIAECGHPFQKGLAHMAAQQLGTIGSGNHYVDLFEDENDGALWVGVHFGSRGFGHRTATWALDRIGQKSQGMNAPPAVIRLRTELAELYIDGMERAGRYAYAGRDWVVDRVLRILGATALDRVHNHHNFAWKETHDGRELWVHRKGATPAFPGQRGFVGGTMGEPAVILEGRAGERSEASLYSTVHGAGRVLSRTRAAGKRNRRTGQTISPGLVDFKKVKRTIAEQGIELRGGGADEAPECYKRLSDVLAHHGNTVRVLHVLRPIGVAMAGRDEYDPFRD